MRLRSHLESKGSVSFKDAALNGIAPRGGLFMPTHWVPIEAEVLSSFRGMKFQDMAKIIVTHLLSDEIPELEIAKIVDKCFDFPVPLIQLDEHLSFLELFQGPTMAFKDFGARFMAQIFDYFLRESKQKVTILVATSGDTGSAVASGMALSEYIDVVLLYPEGKVSDIQEQQLTFPQKNLTSIAINGSFDDCQKLVKMAFADGELSQQLKLSSANSINIARLIPQSLYYFYAFNQVDRNKDVIFSVPSGNLGNITGGLFAKFLGLEPVHFIASLNRNHTFKEYLDSGVYRARSSVKTLSNAMDVGDPSNFVRIKSLFQNDLEEIKASIACYSFSDAQTKDAIKEIYQSYKYICDPHGAVGYLGAKSYLREHTLPNAHVVILETAHPAKFLEVVEPILGIKIPMPGNLQKFQSNVEKKSIKLESNFALFKQFLLDKIKN